MIIGSTAVARAMQTVLDFAEMSTKTGEMATAANRVIGERVVLMAQATRNPLAGDYAEFARMLPRKGGRHAASMRGSVGRSVGASARCW